MTTPRELAETRRLYAAFDLAIDWIVDTLMFVDDRTDSDDLLDVLDDADLVELLLSFSDEAERNGAELVLTLENGREPLRLNLATRHWRHGVLVGRGVVAAMASFTGEPDTTIADRLFARLGRLLLKSHRDMECELRALEARA